MRFIKYIFTVFLLFSTISSFAYEMSEEEKILMQETLQAEQLLVNEETKLNNEIAETKSKNKAKVDAIQNETRMKIDNSLEKQRAFYEKICEEYKGEYDSAQRKCSFEVVGQRGKKKKRKTFSSIATTSEHSGVNVFCEQGFFEDKPKKGCSFGTGRWIDYKLSCKIPSLNQLYEYSKNPKLTPKKDICLWGKDKVNYIRKRNRNIAIAVGVVIVVAAVTVLTLGIGTAPATGIGVAASGGAATGLGTAASGGVATASAGFLGTGLSATTVLSATSAGVSTVGGVTKAVMKKKPSDETIKNLEATAKSTTGKRLIKKAMESDGNVDYDKQAEKLLEYEKRQREKKVIQ